MKSNDRFKWGEGLVPGIALVFGIAYWIQIVDAPKTAIHWPIIVTVITLVFWLAIVIRLFIQPKKADKTQTKRTVVTPDETDTRSIGLEKPPLREKKKLTQHGWVPPMLILLLPVLYLVAMPYTGFALGSFIFLLSLFKLLGGKSWMPMVGIAFLVTTMLYVAMVVLMQIALPRLAVGGFLL